jgi:hypothetical protein
VSQAPLSGKASATPITEAVLLLAIGGADYADGLNTVVTVGPVALLFLWRRYGDPAPQARPAPRFDSARGLRAANACALAFAKGGHVGAVDTTAPVVGPPYLCRGPSSSAGSAV